jgi:hypothetical protein
MFFLLQSSVGITTGWTVGIRFPVGADIFLPSTATRLAVRLIKPPIQCVPGMKRPGREADHSLPSSVEVKNGGAILPLPDTSS